MAKNHYFNGATYVLLLAWMLLFLPSVSHSKHNYQIDVDYKGGSKQISQISALIPILQTTNQRNLIYCNTVGTLTFSNQLSTREINVGFGFRKILAIKSREFIAGMYGFHDIHYTKHNHSAQQFVGGVEILGTNAEIRFNGYFPIKRKLPSFIPSNKEVKNQGGDIAYDDTNLYFRGVQRSERVLGGFDGEMGIRIYKLPVNFYVGYFHFYEKDVGTVQGPRTRIDCKLWRWLRFGGEYANDRYRKHQWYITIGFRFNITTAVEKWEKQPSFFTLNSKMVQRPIRDVDIITLVADDIKPAMQISTMQQLLDAIETARARDEPTDIAIIEDIDGLNTLVKNTSSVRDIKDCHIAGVQKDISSNKIVGARFAKKQFPIFE